MSIGLVLTFNIMMFFLSIIFSATKSNKELNSFFLILSSFLTALYAIQRDFDYGDTINYVNFYLFDHSYLDFEPIFDATARVFMSFTPADPTYFLFFCAMITSILFYLAYRNLVGISNSYLVYWIFLSTFSFHYLTFEVIRSGVAVGLMMLGLSYLVKDKSWIKYYLSIILAIGFHYSIIPFLLLPFLFLLKKEIHYFLLFITVGVFGKTLFMAVGNATGLPIVTQKLEYYMMVTSESQTILLRNLILIGVTPIIYRISRSKTYFNFYFLYIMMLAITLGIDEINRRYLFVGPALLVCVFWEYFKQKKYGIWLFILYMFVYFHLFLMNYLSMYGLLNYEPIFKIA